MFIEKNTKIVNKDADFALKAKKGSLVVEVFSAMVAGDSLEKFGQAGNKAVEEINALAKSAGEGNLQARAELNNIQKIMLEPRLLERLELLNVMGSYSRIGYADAVYAKQYKHEVRSDFQAIDADVPFGTTSYNQVSLSTRNIAGGYMISPREILTGNLDVVAEGIEQTMIDMQNKVLYLAIDAMKNGIKNATGVKYYAESAGVTDVAVMDMVKKIRRYGRTSLIGDYSVVSQLNDLSGYTTDNITNELMDAGLLGRYKGSAVVEAPNSYNFTEMNTAGDNFKLYLPENLLFVVPNNNIAPLQIIQRGDVRSASAYDIYTNTEMVRFDMEFGFFFDETQSHSVGLIVDTTL
jgi:hypothetical protein